jgi:hypothetical protein
VSSKRCEGQLPQVCSASGVWLEAGASCPFVCDDGGCTGVCTPTSLRCQGLDPQSCDGTGQWHEAGAPCPFSCDAGSCSGSCKPGTVQCGTGGASGPVGGIDTCTSAGDWDAQPCAQPTPDCIADSGAPACACTGTLCSSGACAHLESDPRNCGTCAHSCLGGACVGGACQPFALVSLQEDPYDLAIDGTNVYWVDDIAQGTVNACALTGCNNTPTVLATGQSMPTGITASQGIVYWVNYGVGVTGGSVQECASTGCGGNPTPVATGQDAPTAVAVAGNGSIYWTTQNGVMKCSGTLPCTPSTLGPTGSDIVVDANNAYWTAQAGPVRCALGGCGGAPTAIATGQLSSWAIAVDSANVYWTTLSGFTVAKCALSGTCGGNPTTLSAATRPYGVAVDGATVYWVDFTVGTVSACATGGCAGKATILASGQTSPAAVAVDATAVYWVNYANPGGAVMKLAK